MPLQNLKVKDVPIDRIIKNQLCPGLDGQDDNKKSPAKLNRTVIITRKTINIFPEQTNQVLDAAE